MEKNEKRHVHNPRTDAGLLSAITFKWLFGTFLKGYKRELEEADLYSPLDEHASQNLGNKIEQEWTKEYARCQKLNKNESPSLLKVLRRCFGIDIMVLGIGLVIVEFCVKLSQPIILANFLRYFSNEDSMAQAEAFYWGTGIFLGIFLDGMISHPVAQGLMHIGMKIRVACCSLIYKKLLRISKASTESETSIGQMINLLSNDVNRLDYCVFSLHYLWIAPIQTILITYLLYMEVGLATFGGILILLLFLPIHGCYGKLVSYLTLKCTYRTDERLRLINEIIKGVKIIKMYAWEKPFSHFADKAREKEVKNIRNNCMATEICWSFETYIPRACVFVTILIYILFGNDISAEKVYLVTSYYNVLRTTVYRMLALGIKDIAEALVSINRLRNFLLYKEIQTKLLIKSNDTASEIRNNSAISFKNVTAKYNSESKSEVLRQITFNIKSGSLTAIIGQVGAGKSSIFYAMLNEIDDIEGEININGKISYSSQEPWLFASSIKQNILFGQPMNQKRYEKVIEVCQLKRDFELLPHGDNTLVGERGINLSGGQCARVNLARAVYYEADIYLLDDPLSAVDAHVGKSIFQDCINNFLRNKTVVLITHQYQYLKHVNTIMVVESGGIVSEGTYDELLNSGLDLAKLMECDSESKAVSEDMQIFEKESIVNEQPMDLYTEEDEKFESRTYGNIKATTYLQYLKVSRNNFLVFFVFFICVICQVASSGLDYFIAYWVNVEESGTIGNFTANYNDDPLRGRGWYIYIYSFIIGLTILVTLLQAYTFFEMCMKISRNLHALMFNCIIKARMAFFNANPIGRIMNRFSKDTGIVDTRIPLTLLDVTQITIYVIAVLGIVSSVNPWLLIPALILVIIAYFFRCFYIKTSRSIKRLEGITRSPVFNHVSASVHGLTTIRALNAQKILMKEFDDHQDLHSSAWFIFFSGSRAFGMYNELLCTVFTGIVTYTLLLLHNLTSAGDVGLAISQLILFSGIMQWGVRQTAELENQMTSVERILEYTKLDEEPGLESRSDNQIPINWLQKGQIIFENVNLIYGSQNNPALKNLNFTIEPQEMIGIVGRTGAGKSSLINALFRLAEIEGKIYIDNIETSKIALQDLRSKISIIPQEPVLFAGNLRRNLDPLEEYSDHVLWQALQDVELKTFLDSDLGLYTKVTEGGTNFSVGQRQLLCLARAIVRNNQILVLDEATANVDPRTDELVQKTIRRKFGQSTVLIIAHRLNTVMDCDKILVMDAGQVMEYDSPYELLQNKNGVLYNMIQQTGSSMAANLYQIAKSNHERKVKKLIYQHESQL